MQPSTERTETRILLAGLFTETNTFVEEPTRLDAFLIRRGQELLDVRGDHSPTDGFLETAELLDWTVIPAIDYRAAPSGTVEDCVFEQYWTELRPIVVAALEAGLDGIFLVLHGAMVTWSHPDAEGELLARIRGVSGVENLPIVAVLDLHANVTQEMARKASALIAYRENPHTDVRETAVRAAKLLDRALKEKCILNNYLRHSGMLLAPPATSTGEDPIQSLEVLARDLEMLDLNWEVGIAPGFAHADMPEAGMTFWVVGPGDEDLYQSALAELVDKAHSLSDTVTSREIELSLALEHIQRDKKFPALLIEPADNIGGGGPGDMTHILRALLAFPDIGRCGVIINDPEAVRILSDSEPGERVSISVGGKGSRLDLGPVCLDVTLISLSDGCFELSDKQSHLAGGGSNIDMGPTAVVTHEHITILITSLKTPPFDLGQWTSQGVDPAAFAIIGVKAAIGHRRAYDSITASSYTIQTPGPCTSDLHSLPYRNLRRPIFPLDN